MPRFSRAQQDARRAIIALESSNLPLEQVGQRLIQAIGLAVPFDGYRLVGTDPATLLINRLIAASENDTWARAEWLNDVYLQSDLPYVELPNLMRMNATVVAYQQELDQCWGYQPGVFAGLTASEHHDTFHQSRSPVGGTLLANFAASGQWVASLQLYRRDPDVRFQRSDISFVQRMAPTIGRILHTGSANERTLELEDHDVPTAAGVMIIDRAGNLRHSNPAGVFWRELLLDLPNTNDHQLATPIASTIAALHSSGEPAISMLAPTRIGSVRIEASPESTGRNVTLVITPDSVQPPPPIPARWQLTAQEQHIVTLLLRGDSNARIAAELMISPNTVQTHLRHIYEKLNVGNRTQVLAAYFREGYARGLAAVGTQEAQ